MTRDAALLAEVRAAALELRLEGAEPDDIAGAAAQRVLAAVQSERAEADRLADAAADIVEVLAPFYVGDLPAALAAVAVALRRADEDPSAAIEDARDALRRLSRAKP